MNPQTDLFAARQAAKDRQERAAARVQRDPTEVELVRLLTDFLTIRLRVDGSVNADIAGSYLDSCGVVKLGTEGQSVRRRIISTAFCQGRGTLWQHGGWQQGKAGRPISTWIPL